MHRLCLLIFLFSSEVGFSQIEITWSDLEDVQFSDLYIEEVDEYVLYPHFGPIVRDLEGKEVILSGYILALSPEEGYYVLSKGPFASCFFCGSGGPETIVELNLKSEKDYFMMDQFITIKGVFRLNSEDIYHCNYILDYAEAH
tara:strand:- start:135 stop:563 length:429 start_codon:yes stop_codon:yes gene_type:complete